MIPTDEGYTVETETGKNAEITTVKITDAEGAAKLGKPIGEYISVRSPSYRTPDVSAHTEIAQILAENIRRLMNIGRGDAVLVVGLGNSQVPSDVLGASVARNILVTRHIYGEVKEQDGRLRPVASLIPGVMGATGIDTAEIVKGVCDRVKPALVVVVDALAAQTIENLNAVIQVADSGISPGSAGGAGRGGVNAELLGVPVISIGAPVVIDAVTLAKDVCREPGKGGRGAGFTRKELLEEYDLSFVAPKEEDVYIGYLTDIIAAAVNMALHDGLTVGELRRSMV